MNQVEVLMAAVLFLGSLGASMAVWSRAVGALAADQERLVHLDRLEAELVAGESRLRDPFLRQGGPLQPCGVVLHRLVEAIERVPAAEGMERHLSLPPPGDRLQLRLVAGGEERIRLYSPAAFGGCGAAGEVAGGGSHGA
jgi:hypothetical protein